LVCGGWDNSLLGVFISLVGRQKFPACGAREFARQGLDLLLLFSRPDGGFQAKIDKIPGWQGKREFGPARETGRGQGTARLAGDRLPGTGPNAGARAICSDAIGKLVHSCTI
jgi:hypothetical protein